MKSALETRASETHARLVAGLRDREERAFNDIYALYGDNVYSFAMRLSGRREVADELFQHAFVRLAERGGRLSADTNLLAWLLTVVRNHFRSERRRSVTHQRHERAVADATIPVERPDESAERRVALDRLSRALMMLAEHHREVLLLVVEAEDVPQEQLARVLDVTPSVFRKRLSRARLALTSLLQSEELS